MKLPISIFLLLPMALAQADDSALRHCRTMVDAGARLSCYDALPVAPLPTAATGPAASAPAAPATTAAASFGLERPVDGMQEISSRIAGQFEGWRAGARIRLANGQLWQVIDDSSAVYDLRDPKVTVRRAAMGSFMLDIEGARRMPRVRRLE